MKSEKGQALPLVMIAVVIGALVIPPFLGHAGSSLIGSRIYAQAIHAQYAGDSGAEHAIWSLTNGGLTANLTSSGDSVSYSLDELINGLGANITVSNGWETMASDNFESGGWTGGTGWLDDWYYEGNATVTTSGTPYEGSYHLLLTSSDGYVERSVDLSHETSARLQFWAKVSQFESGETAQCLVSDDGSNWTPVYTWDYGDSDNVYHYYDIDLSAYNLSSQFWIAFEANMSGPWDYFYVDDLKVVWRYDEASVASDDFESGGWTGGSGWLDDWYYEGDASIVGAVGGPGGATPYEGSYHLRLRSNTGYVARSVDLSSLTIARLQFWARPTRGFGGGNREAYCLISSNGTDWTTVYTWENGDFDNTYHYYEIDLSPYTLSSEFWIAFEANVDNWDDALYVDDLHIKGPAIYVITSEAGDSAVKAVVKIEDGSVTVLSWYIV